MDIQRNPAVQAMDDQYKLAKENEVLKRGLEAKDNENKANVQQAYATGVQHGAQSVQQGITESIIDYINKGGAVDELPPEALANAAKENGMPVKGFVDQLYGIENAAQSNNAMNNNGGNPALDPRGNNVAGNPTIPPLSKP